MRVTLQVVTRSERGKSVARSMSAARSASDAVAQLQGELGIRLQPLHPDTSDPTLLSWHTTELPDDDRGSRLLEQLRNSPQVAAAFVKPPDAMA